jgi:Plasmid pRiA4b ORF-3-like protein
MAEAGTHVFRVSLEEKLYRDIEIPSRKKLYDLAEAIVAAFGFFFDHPFGFYSLLEGHVLNSPVKYELFADLEDIVPPSDAGSVERTRVSDAFKEIGDAMTFLFDYGDMWQFRIEVIARRQKEPHLKYPRVVKKIGRAPQQYPPEGKRSGGEVRALRRVSTRAAVRRTKRQLPRTRVSLRRRRST